MELAEEYHSPGIIISHVQWAWSFTEYIFVSYYVNYFQNSSWGNNEDFGKDLARDEALSVLLLPTFKENQEKEEEEEEGIIALDFD